MNDELVCLYHGGCIDGFGAAMAVKLAHPHAELVAAYYDRVPDYESLRGKGVIMVDFCYTPPVMQAISEVVRYMLVLDHHETAMRRMLEYSSGFDCWKIWSADTALIMVNGNTQYRFDMTQSGAMMAWKHVYPNSKIPAVVAAIQDHDLHKFELRNTAEICAVLYSLPMSFAYWRTFFTSPRIYEGTLEQGAAILRYKRKCVEDTIKSSRGLCMAIGGHVVPVANVPYYLANDVANALSEEVPTLFAAVYADTSYGRKFSLRSTGEGMNVADIAMYYGGGGHAHAAAFTLPPSGEANKIILRTEDV